MYGNPDEMHARGRTSNKINDPEQLQQHDGHHLHAGEEWAFKPARRNGYPESWLWETA
jgi:hypothetical protein